MRSRYGRWLEDAMARALQASAGGRPAALAAAAALGVGIGVAARPASVPLERAAARAGVKVFERSATDPVERCGRAGPPMPCHLMVGHG